MIPRHPKSYYKCANCGHTCDNGVVIWRYGWQPWCRSCFIRDRSERCRLVEQLPNIEPIEPPLKPQYSSQLFGALRDFELEIGWEIDQ